jgi:hypothetical protein
VNILRRRWKESALGLLVIAVLYACTLTGEGYVGGVYDPPGYEYGSWGGGYYVAPPRGGGHGEEQHGGQRANDRRQEQPRQEQQHQQPQQRAYKPAPPSRPAPSIPDRPRGR